MTGIIRQMLDSGGRKNQIARRNAPTADAELALFDAQGGRGAHTCTPIAAAQC